MLCYTAGFPSSSKQRFTENNASIPEVKAICRDDIEPVPITYRTTTPAATYSLFRIYDFSFMTWFLRSWLVKLTTRRLKEVGRRVAIIQCVSSRTEEGEIERYDLTVLSSEVHQPVMVEYQRIC